MAISFAAILGSIGGALTLLIILTLLLYCIIFHFRNFPNKDSETESSVPSAVLPQEATQFRMEELEEACKHFNGINLIGSGSFGLVFKGLLCDGTFVAIKRRTSRPTQEFADEAAHLSAIQHRNLVTLLGYCQERDRQMLVFEYLPNGSICSHLYDSTTTTKLEFKQRVSIAIGAAKGLRHLHGLQPPLVHSNFKTSKVLVDEDFIAKVGDAGLSKLIHHANAASPFKDPALGKHDAFQETSDVYSFGVFLLELISGKEVTSKEVQNHLSSNVSIDHRLIGTFTKEGMRDLMRLMVKCTRFAGRERPKMENVVMDLDRILENEIKRTTIMGEGDAIITLGSQLFMN